MFSVWFLGTNCRHPAEVGDGRGDSAGMHEGHVS